MVTVYLALGSNVGNSKRHFSKTIELLSKRVTNITVAPLYSSKAIGYTQQADFMNTVLRGDTFLAPLELLKFTQETERLVGRIRRFRWGPREIDIDIVFYDDQIVTEPGLHIPHVRFSERDFVLKPMCDLAPNFVDPLSKQTINKLLEQLPQSELSILGEIE